MANALYGLGRNKFARGEINWLASAGDTIKICLLKAAYTPSIDTHEFFTSLGANVVGNAGGTGRSDCPTLTLIDPTLGVVDANDSQLNSVPGSVGQCNYLCIFKDGGSDGTSPLLALIDTAGGTLPITPNGNNITVTWDSGANRIFKL